MVLFPYGDLTAFLFWRFVIVVTIDCDLICTSSIIYFLIGIGPSGLHPLAGVAGVHVTANVAEIQCLYIVTSDESIYFGIMSNNSTCLK